MRTFKTPQKDRTDYIYYPATGRAIKLTPDEIDEEWIATLHAEDDAVCDSDYKERRHTAFHYGVTPGSGDEGLDESKMACLADPAPDPLEYILENFDAQEHQGTLVKLRAAIQKLQPQQVDLIYQSFYAKRTNVDIAAEQGVTEAAIRNRLKKIYARLRIPLSLNLESGHC